jgi:GNAT superfamily N-acetyltransferase
MEEHLLSAPENFTIRPAAPNDVAVIMNLVRQLAAYEKLEGMITGDESMMQEAVFGKIPSCECLIAEENAKPVGFALYFTTFSTFLCKPGLYLEDLFVVPAARGKGYGKALLIHLAQLAKNRDCGRFEWRVLDWNEPSIQFYQSLGATIMPEWQLVRMTTAEIAQLAKIR